MKVIGLGSPDDLRVRFDASEVDVLVDVLRDLRAKATRDAAETYATTPLPETRPIDDRHDRLRGLEGLLMQLEEQPAPAARRRPPCGRVPSARPSSPAAYAHKKRQAALRLRLTRVAGAE